MGTDPSSLAEPLGRWWRQPLGQQRCLVAAGSIEPAARRGGATPLLGRPQYPASSKLGGTGGAPPTDRNLLRNQRQRPRA